MAAVCLMSACVVVPPLPTRSGKPEVVFTGKHVTKKKIVDRMAYYLTSEGYKIKQVDDYSAVFVRHSSSWRYVGNQSFQEQHDEQVTLNTFDSEIGIEAVGAVETVSYTHDGRPLTQDHSFYGPKAQWLFDLLLKIKADLEGTVGQEAGLAGKVYPPAAP